MPVNDLYLLAILNSKLIFHYFKRFAAVLGDADNKGRLRWFSQDVEKIPVRKIDFSNNDEKSSRDSMILLVEKMLDLNKKLPSAKTPDEKTRLERKINATDNQIDQLVYQIYGLTKKEIEFLEAKNV